MSLATTRAPELVLEGITKRFGGVTALDAVSLTIRPGTVHALLGENGAGKTTLMRVAFGLVAADQGRVMLAGRAVRFASPAAAIAAGIGMVHQHFSLVGALTVAENVALGGHGRYSAKDATEHVRAVSARTGLALDPAARVDDLPVSAQQRLEIVKALSRDARLLILDEPTAVLAPSEASDLLTWVRRFADAGGSVVLITHKLADALAMSDDVTVLRRGARVLATAAAETDADALVTAMLGERPVGGPRINAAATTAAASIVSTPGPASKRGAAVVSLENVSYVDERGIARVRGASCAVHAGEIVGIAAIEGSGQHELLRLLAGRLDPTAGSAVLPSAVGFVPEDRQRDALLLDSSLGENVALRGAGRARGTIRWPDVAAHTTALISRFDVRGGGAAVMARGLSGGNQQKLVIARELDPAPTALVVENPTRGLDLRASAAVLGHLRAAREAGLAVVLYSTDLDEVLALSDRVLIVHDGAVRPAASLDRDQVGRAMLGTS